MDLSFLSNGVLNAIRDLLTEKIYEIRLRENYKITVNYMGTRRVLSDYICKKDDIDFIINTVTEKSVYAYNDYIKNGFITTKNGVRIGICGQCVYQGDNIITIKNISSVNIRIPHLISGCSDGVFSKIIDNNSVYNSLIIAPPFCGKTTIVKDLAIKLNKSLNKNILIIDERGEFSVISGENIDKISFSNKYFAFNYALRSMSPDIVLTDELISDSDWRFVGSAISSGIKVIATIHADSISNLKDKKEFIDGLFCRYFVLRRDSIGIIDKTFDKDMKEI
ncbi:MAG: Flp pilus assembly complex ATPase component TadA [Clostridia bacterium]|nr:Flp pilus assembly complex ATPase component TadA [Clostridia bacterium]